MMRSGPTKLPFKIQFGILSFLIFMSCECKQVGHQQPKETYTKTTKLIIMNDSTPKVIGIGGIFFRSKDPKKTNEWYAKNLGLAVNKYGSSFEFRNTHRPEEINYLQWSTFNENTKYFDPSTKEFMINYRVQNIEGLVNKLKKNGVQILDDIESYDYGKFVHIMDLEGNKIELWEPVDSVLTAIGSETTK